MEQRWWGVGIKKKVVAYEPSLIHLISRYLLSVCFVLDALQGADDSVVDKTWYLTCLTWELGLQEGAYDGCSPKRHEVLAGRTHRKYH